MREFLQKLMDLGIERALIEHTVPESQYEEVYYKASAAIKGGYAPLLQITMHWQLLALVGNVNALSEMSDEDLKGCVDKRNGNILLYLAWSGKLEALIWAKANFQGLFFLAIHNASPIAHYAALSGNPKMLDWIKANYPELLVVQLEYCGTTIAHFATLSGNPKMLDWIKANCPGLLTQMSHYGHSIVHSAAVSGSAPMLNKALDLNPNPFGVFVVPFKKKEISINTLRKALVSNYRITHLALPYNTDESIKQEIEFFATRNQDLEKACLEFKVFLQGVYCQDNGSLYILNHDEILFTLFKNSLPSNHQIPEDVIHWVFKNIIDRLKPDGRKVFKQQVIMSHEITQYISQMESSRCSWMPESLMKPENNEINLLHQLNDLVNRHYPSMESFQSAFSDFYKHHYGQINQQRNAIHQFFQPNDKTRARVLFEEICQNVGIDFLQLQHDVKGAVESKTNTL